MKPLPNACEKAAARLEDRAMKASHRRGEISAAVAGCERLAGRVAGRHLLKPGWYDRHEQGVQVARIAIWLHALKRAGDPAPIRLDDGLAAAVASHAVIDAFFRPKGDVLFAAFQIVDPDGLGGGFEPPSDVPPPDVIAMQNERSEALGRLVAGLGEPASAIVRLRFGLDAGEAVGTRRIAEIVGLPLRTVERRLASALDRLLKELEPWL